jgi:hypothetical protein
MGIYAVEQQCNYSEYNKDRVGHGWRSESGREIVDDQADIPGTPREIK